MKRYLSLVAATLIVASGLKADLLAFGAGVGVWSASPSGDLNYKNANKFDIKGDTGLSSATKPYVWAFVEHPVIFLPNVKLDYSSYKDSATKNTNISFAGETFTTSTKTQLTLNELDTTLYYSLPIPLIDIDLGFGAKSVGGDLTLSDSTKSKKEKLNVLLPYGYLGVRFDIPATSVGLSGDVKYIGFKKSSLSDMKFAVDYGFIDSVVKLGVEAGYRTKRIVLDDIGSLDVETDMKISGAFGGVFARF